MSFVQREITRINAALDSAPTEDVKKELYAAQQALSWTLEPNGFASPYKMIIGQSDALNTVDLPLQPLDAAYGLTVGKSW